MTNIKDEPSDPEVAEAQLLVVHAPNEAQGSLAIDATLCSGTKPRRGRKARHRSEPSGRQQGDDPPV